MKQLARKPKLFRTFTGLTIEHGNALYIEIEQQYPKQERKRLGRKNRRRAIGARRKFKRPMQDRMLMALMYYRLYITNELLGYLFDLDQSTIRYDIVEFEKGDILNVIHGRYEASIVTNERYRERVLGFGK